MQGDRGTALCFLLVFAGFTLTSSTYLAWVYHLMDFVPSEFADGLSMVGGYFLQALGIGLMAAVGRMRPGAYGRISLTTIVALHFACAAPAVLGTSLWGVISFGLVMNVLCGCIAAHYLQRLSGSVPERRRGIVFGGGYAASIVVSWLLTFAQGVVGSAVSIPLIACLTLSALAVGAVLFGEKPPSDGTGAGLGAGRFSSLGARADAIGEADAGTSSAYALRPVIGFAIITVLLMSLVKNTAFGFPAADVADGVSLEFTRLFYAAGLVVAGVVIDRNRRHGAFCCLAALVTPFIVLALSGEPVSATALWALDYFFYGFFSVFRVILFADLASQAGLPHLSGFGLMFGRVGDAAGTAIYLTLGNSVIALVTVAAVLFATTLFVFYRLAQMVFRPKAPEDSDERDEKRAFEEFASRHGLSARERDVLKLLLAERSNAEIATELFVSESTVKFHVRNLLKKTSCQNRLELRDKYNTNPPK